MIGMALERDMGGRASSASVHSASVHSEAKDAGSRTQDRGNEVMRAPRTKGHTNLVRFATIAKQSETGKLTPPQDQRCHRVVHGS